MKSLYTLTKKETLLGIGLMSGTSADGMDAALVEISGSGTETKVTQKGFVSIPYANEIRETILRLATGVSGGSKELSLFHFLLGQLSLEACKEVCRQSGVSTSEVDFVGSHGQTLYYIPVATPYLGHMISATLQLGEPSVICEGMDCVVVSDFRVRDMAAGGCGAPLVPYTEFLLYRSNDETVGLQNIGGIGNITVLPRAGSLEDTYAFDTGPGNMVMDALVQIITNGEKYFDDGGYMAAKGFVNEELLSFMLQDPYLSRKPPKTTGREDYGADYVTRLVAFGEERSISLIDMLATATRFTAE